MDPLNTTKVISPVTYLIAGVALLLVGAIIGAFADPYLPASLSNTQKGYQSGFTVARTLVENSNFGSMFRKTPDDIRALVGIVTAVGENNFTLHTPSGNPFDDQTFVDRTIILEASTNVTRIMQQDPIKGLPGTTTAMTIVPPAKSIPAIASDIKVGDMVNVLASENVKTLKEFTATEVQILPKIPSL